MQKCQVVTSESSRDASFSVGDKSWLSYTNHAFLPSRQSLQEGRDPVKWKEEEGRMWVKKGEMLANILFAFMAVFILPFSLRGEGTSFRVSPLVEAWFSRGVWVCLSLVVWRNSVQILVRTLESFLTHYFWRRYEFLGLVGLVKFMVRHLVVVRVSS